MFGVATVPGFQAGGVTLGLLGVAEEFAGLGGGPGGGFHGSSSSSFAVVSASVEAAVFTLQRTTSGLLGSMPGNTDIMWARIASMSACTSEVLIETVGAVGFFSVGLLVILLTPWGGGFPGCAARHPGYLLP